jgi:two-component system sensor histidine kinase RpfC
MNAVHAARSLRALPENVVSFAEHSRRLAPADGARLHVLIAEDNETNRRVLRAILARAGHRLTVVEDGDAALDALQRQGETFDLLVSTRTCLDTMA